ncbi:hypothetical protein ILUMI_25586 [Ignelater luminosus]|uniref:Uncharacterized protein n=1 Tax=Ignelater luminosus TaxID=2038154 RepID=A0A8K0FXT6_IGNLU|nr:hypothetical protein ILUMI_25586 [Ignelater luminosus]
MEHLKENERQNIVAKFYRTHIHLKNVFTVNHFIQMGIPGSTIYAICARVDKHNSTQKKPKSGRPAREMPERLMVSWVFHYGNLVGNLKSTRDMLVTY